MTEARALVRVKGVLASMRWKKLVGPAHPEVAAIDCGRRR